MWIRDSIDNLFSNRNILTYLLIQIMCDCESFVRGCVLLGERNVC